MIDLLRWSGPGGIRDEYHGGHPRDIDAPVLAADVLGRMIAAEGGGATAYKVFADGHVDGLQRLWPMVEALAGRTVDAAFVSGRTDADVAVDVEIATDGAWAEAVRSGRTDDLRQVDKVVLADAAAERAPEVGGLEMPAWWLREERELIGLRGRRCSGCGRVEYPTPPAGCPRCGSALEPHVLATTGRILTWTVDRLYESGVATGLAVVDLDGGGRFYGQLADGWMTNDLAAGMPVHLVPRVLHADHRRTAYFWKVTPAQRFTGQEERSV